MDSPSTAGIETYQPAILFAVLYAALGCLYIWETARVPTYTFIVLVIFCVFRVVGFILRAILAASDGAKENLGIVITEMIFSTLGFVGLLYCVFLLILDRATAVRRVLGENEDESPGGILGLILNQRIIDLTFTAAAGVGIASAAYIGSDWDTSERLRKVTTILYLEITISLFIYAVILVHKENKALRLGLKERAPARQAYVIYLHCPIMFLLLIRQAYVLATFSSDRHNDESLWYPLFATPEFLAACLFSARGLVPRPEELPKGEKQSYWSKLRRAYSAGA